MKQLITLIFIFSFSFVQCFGQSDVYEIERACWGSGERNAMVVSYNRGDSYYVVRTYDFTPSTKHEIVEISNLSSGGITYMRIFVGTTTKTVDIRVLSRIKYGYSGYNSAVELCRRIQNGDI